MSKLLKIKIWRQSTNSFDIIHIPKTKVVYVRKCKCSGDELYSVVFSNQDSFSIEKETFEWLKEELEK